MPDPIVPATLFFDLGDTLVFSDAGGVRRRFDDALNVLQILHARGYRSGLISDQPAGTTFAQVQALLSDL
jgi:hypothetical protein